MKREAVLKAAIAQKKAEEAELERIRRDREAEKRRMEMERKK